MKKFQAIVSDQKSVPSPANKISRSKTNNLRAAAKKKTDNLMTIFNYQYQESDLEQFVF